MDELSFSFFSAMPKAVELSTIPIKSSMILMEKRSIVIFMALPAVTRPLKDVVLFLASMSLH